MRGHRQGVTDMTSTASDEASRGVLVSGASLTDVGRVRSGNEDALVIADLTGTEIVTRSVELFNGKVGMDGILLAVADGLGGAQAGEVASRMAVEQLADTLMATAGALPIPAWVRDALKSVNRYIRSASHESSEYAGMGATITAAVIHGEQAIIGQVGDSRAYLIRDGHIEQVTKDQSMVQALLDAGVLTQEEAVHFPQRSVILHALGTEDDIEPVVSMIKLARGDHMLICSDGLSNKVGNVEMHDAVRDAKTLGDACSRLVALANKRGGEDNITLIIARFDGTGLPIHENDRRIRVEHFKDNDKQTQPDH